MNVWSRQTFARSLKASKPIPTSFARQEVEFGTPAITERVDELAPERLKMIFDPVPRVDGIDSSGDPLIELRSEIYLQSGRRRRAAAAT
jgi:catalase